MDISQEDMDLLNYKEAEERYERERQEKIRKSKKPRPRDIIPKEELQVTSDYETTVYNVSDYNPGTV